LKRLIFGKKNERFVPASPEQSALDFGEQPDVASPETEQETISYKRKKKTDKNKPVRLALPAHLPRKKQVLEPENKEPGAVKIGEAVTEILEYTPGKLYVRQYVRPKYVQQEKVIIAPLPTLPIPQGNAGPSLLAHLMISKFVDHLPYYRQVQQFKREGVTIAESTISGWFRAICKLLDPLYDELRSQVLASDYLMADETPIPVQGSNKPGATHTGYHWVYRSPHQGLILFDYQKGRGAVGPETFLEGFRGALQTDGYAAYDRFGEKPGITLLACMAHARRKFEQAIDNDADRANHALLEIQKLYKIERKCRQENLSADQITDVRQKEAAPILKSLHDWMVENYPNTAPKISIGKALAYSMKLWPRLTRYTENGLWNIDNNLVENSIRPVALGRKNYLFAGSHDAARNAAMIYSFLATCKANDIEPYKWMKDTITNISDTKLSQLSKLLPVK
jgi:transposase